jgi:plastocyanin
MKTRLFSATILSSCLVACGGGDGSQGPGPGTPVIARAASASGDAQTGTVGLALANPLRVIVTVDGAAAAGTTVTWSAAAGGAVTPGSAVTDASGIATTAWTLGHASGAQGAQAALSGASGSPVAFSATALAGAAASMLASGGSGQTGSVGSALATPLQVRVVDQFSNSVSGVTVNWAVTSGGGSVAPASSVTNAQGVASTTQTLPSTAGTATVTASSTGLTSVTLTNTAVATTGTATVQLMNSQFQPSTLTVAAGTAVTFEWNDGITQHTIFPVSPATIPTDPTPAAAPHTYTVTFSTPGTYRYYCSIHGGFDSGGNLTGMFGAIVVQ